MTHKQTITCAECGAHNRPDRLLCVKCGAYLGSRADERNARDAMQRGGAISPFARRQRPRRVLGVLLLLLFLVVAGTAALLVYRQYQELRAAESDVTLPATTTTSSARTSTTAGSTTTKATSADQARVFPSNAKASSSLPPTDQFTYGPSNLSDNDLSTAWNEGASGDGVGEWLSFSFNQPVRLSRIDIANGYQRDQKRYLGNGRVRGLRIEYSNGDMQEIQLYDDMGYQEVQPAVPSDVGISSVRMTILSVYPGESWEDAALSEIRFIGER
ncbi:MAG: Nicotine adenine dinucleotide glycohydrolase (NADase) [Actinobacteria bacterium ADurb.Bin444]|nr:MAG: Nicotine adenine dinucleotide glycohydrolase (NADase) [Actinobacteria bacterium ADurb.Bin444]